jgi:alpha-L-fucosidase
MMDRTVGGIHENVITPEQEIPEKPLGVPWEACMTFTKSWKYVPNEVYKPTSMVIKMLLDVVSRGGNFLLNVGPKPDGTFPEEAVIRLKEIGAWMKVNGEGIYATRAIAPYGEGNVRYTSTKDKSTVYAFVLPDEQGNFPQTVTLSLKPKAGAPITLLGGDAPLAYKDTAAGCVVTLPQGMKTLAIGMKFNS